MAQAYINGSLVTDPDIILGAIVGRSTQMTSLDCPEITKLRAYAFYNMTGLTSVSLQNVVSFLGAGHQFYGCSSLTSVSLPNLVDFHPLATTTGVFNGCSSLQTLSLPKVPTVFSASGTDFTNCTSLTTINLPKVTTIQKTNQAGSMFCKTSALQTLVIGDYSSNITWNDTSAADSQFNGNDMASNVQLYFRSNNVPTIHASTSFAKCGAIYVKPSLVNSFKAATGWSNYASIIQADPNA